MAHKMDKNDKRKKEEKTITELLQPGGKAARSNGRPTTKLDGKAVLDRILQAAWKTDFKDPAKAQRFEGLYKERMLKTRRYHVLHELARIHSRPGELGRMDENAKQFLNWMLEKYPTLLEKTDEDGYTALHAAIKERNTDFVDNILQNEAVVNRGVILEQTCQYGNSLHVAIKQRLPSIELMINKCSEANHIFLEEQLGTKNTPLHLYMSHNDLNGCGGAEYDDIEYEEEDHQSYYSDVYEKSNLDDIMSDDDEHGEKERDWIPLRKGLERTQTIRSEAGLSPFPRIGRIKSFPVSIPHERTTTESVLGVVELLIEKQQSVLWKTNADMRTPYQERIHYLTEAAQEELDRMEQDSDDGTTDREAYLRRLEDEDPITTYIRSYCMKKLPRDRIMASLYRPGQERQIEFDLGGFPSTSISLDYLDRLSKHLRFESILKYVALPRISIESPRAVRNKARSIQQRRQGLSDFEAVFKWLSKNRVKKILKVMIVDDGEPSHADASIEAALKGFDVEVWDWKRLDLSTEVIYNSTQVVREISLYSTGNNAVLMGWMSSEGLLNSGKFPKLQDVYLIYREGQEDHARLMEYVSKFKKTVEDGTGGRVKVHSTPDSRTNSYASGFRKAEGYQQTENPWIEVLATFSKLMRTIPDQIKAPPVKIAIIDDGVDVSHLSLDGTIATGKSFCPYAHSTDLMNSYYVPSGNHGTCMATLIRKICPEISFYVARLDERHVPGSGQRQITAKSAADAVRWATDCGVDIISMSWTIETPVFGNKDMESLKDAIAAAARANIIMFCSTSDQGSLTKEHCYPGDFDGCIRIGGATDTGEALTWVNSDKVHFLLPGHNVPFVNNEGHVMSSESGSSVATAAASGLAGLLMYSSWILGYGEEYLRDNKNMCEAIKAISTAKMFPKVQQYFDERFKQELLRTEGPGSRQRQKQPSLGCSLSTMVWNENCDEALKRVLKPILEQH